MNEQGSLPQSSGSVAPRVPKAAYVDPQIALTEEERVFARSWVFIGFESEVPERGDYVLRRMGSDRVIMARTESGEIAVLLNACTHRGTAICESTSGNSAHFRCSYHGWTFGNDGTLVGVPGLRRLYPQSFNKSDMGLRQPRVHRYRELIFATWSEEPPAFDAYLGDAKFYLDTVFDLSTSGWEVMAPPQRVRARGNWKYLQDNLSGDGYHLQTTHAMAFEQGVFDKAEGIERDGCVIAADGGHTVRIGYGRRPGSDFWIDGMPTGELPGIAANLTPDQRAVIDRSEFIHGGVFPNAAFLSNSQSEVVADLDGRATRFVVWRLHHPISAEETEIWYWVLVPRHFPDDWKEASYAMQARVQSAGGLFFEHDDFENTSRLAAANQGSQARALAQDLTLGTDFTVTERAAGRPGSVQETDISEHNQRAFYRRYLELMEGRP